jgi:hypothetical protein
MLALTMWWLASACGGNTLGNLSADESGDLRWGEPTREPFDAALVAACGQGGTADAGEQALLRTPYLQDVKGDSVSLLWTTEQTEPSRVRVTTPGDDGVVAEATARIDSTAILPTGAQWHAELSGLSPGTIYCYEIEGGDGAWTDPTGFRTAPSLDAGTVRFAALGDLGARTGDQFAVLEQLVKVPFELAVLTGDVGYPDGRIEDFESNYFGVYAQLIDRVPFVPASGNHEYNTQGARPFITSFVLPHTGGASARERWYSTDWGPVHFAIIDTEAITGEQVAWLDRDLAETPAVWRVVVGHRPPYSSGYHGSDAAIRDALVPVFERRGVDLVLSGHDHDYERTHPINDVTYVVTGGGGVGTRPVGSSEFTAFSIQVSHFVIMEATADTLTLWAIDATGKVFDTMRLGGQDAARRPPDG